MAETRCRHLPNERTPATLYSGQKFDTNVAALIPHKPAHLPAIWCFCSSPEYNEAVRRIDQTLKVTNATLVKVPFDLAHWHKSPQEKYPNGLPKPHSDDPTQWLFNGHRPAQHRAAASRRRPAARLPLAAEQDSHGTLRRRPTPGCRSRKPSCHADKDGIVCLPACAANSPPPSGCSTSCARPTARSGRTRSCTSCSPMPAASLARRWTTGCATSSSSSTASSSTTARSSGTSGTAARTASPAW